MSLGPGRSGRRNGPQVEQRNWTKGSKNTWATHNVLDKMPHTRVGKAKRAHQRPPPGGHGGQNARLFPPSRAVTGNPKLWSTRTSPPYAAQSPLLSPPPPPSSPGPPPAPPLPQLTSPPHPLS